MYVIDIILSKSKKRRKERKNNGYQVNGTIHDLSVTSLQGSFWLIISECTIINFNRAYKNKFSTKKELYLQKTLKN